MQYTEGETNVVTMRGWDIMSLREAVISSLANIANIDITS